PESAPEPAMSVIAEGSGAASWRYDLAEDRSELLIERKGGLDRFDAIDMTTGADIAERFAIGATDPASARAELAWKLTRRRGDWRIRVEAAIAMASTQRHFKVHQRLVAFEGDREIFARDWEKEIERDLV